MSETSTRKLFSAPNLRSETRERRRSVLHLIEAYLTQHRFHSSVEALRSEAASELTQEYKVCENVDLEIILQEYLSYYKTKFQKEAKILRKIDGEEKSKAKLKQSKSKMAVESKDKMEIQAQPSSELEDFHFEIISLGDTTAAPPNPPAFPQNHREMAAQIVEQNLPIIPTTWSDCIGLEPIIEKLKEAVVYPTLYPDIFQGLETWRGILLYGPPGTGKTLLARATAAHSNSFYNVTAAGFISKWRGESEKMVMALFEEARRSSPATIFVDEIDALACDSDDHHGATRRFRSELLTQMDGLHSSAASVFVLASTNRPWDLDAALLRRFERRVRVPTPDERSRLRILQRHLTTLETTDELTTVVRDKMDGFTGAEVRVVCKAVSVEAAARRAREAARGGKTAVKRVTVDEVRRAVEKMRPCCPDGRRYDEWEEKYGCP